MRRCWIAAGLLATIATLGTPVSAQMDPAAADVLRAATEYFGTYTTRVSGVSLEEAYLILEVSGGRVNNTRRITSDLIVLNLAGRVISLRDAFALDDNPLRERTPRIVSILARPSQTTWDQAQAYASDSNRLVYEPLIALLNDPAVALRFIAPENQARVTYKIDGRKKMEGVEVVGLRFEEPKSKSADYVIKTRGKARARGRVWVEPATGRIHRTELTMESDSEIARISVDYAHDKALDLMLPASMVDTYEMSEVVGPGMSNMGAGSSGIGRRGYDCRASYSNARFTPIELSGPK